MKILIVASDFPWPKTQGGHLRLTTAIDALAELGETDLFALYDYRRPTPALPPTVSVQRLRTVARRGSARQLRWRVAWLVRRGIPMEVAMQRRETDSRLEFESWAGDRYDFVWFERATTFEAMGRPRLGPTVVDLVDLEDAKARLRANIMRSNLARKPVSTSIRQIIAVAQARLNARDWHKFQHSVAASVDRVVLSSDRDLHRSRLTNAVVVPNSYERPERAVGRIEVRKPSVALFQATFDYAPNVDAADWLVSEVTPRLRARIADLEIRLVGQTVPGVERYHNPPGVTVVGAVPTMMPELTRADIVVVPIRYGSGTRLKILESFAHRVPVVSTTIGAEGLQVEDGVHLLLADDPDGFAAACERLLTEPTLRARLVDAAERLYLEQYESSIARDRVQALVRTVTSGMRTPKAS